MGAETFGKVLGIHLKITKMMMEHKSKRLVEGMTVEEENEVLNEMVILLNGKIHDIEIYGIYHGVLEGGKVEGYCEDCVDGGNELSWLEEGKVMTSWKECETCGGTGENKGTPVNDT